MPSPPRRSPALPWDVIETILALNWTQPVDLFPSKAVDISQPPGRDFLSRVHHMNHGRADMLAWMRVSKDANVVASRLYYSSLVFSSTEHLVKFRELVEQRTSLRIGSLVRFLQIHRLEHGHDQDGVEAGWWDEMRRLVRLLPNLVVIRGNPRGSWGVGESHLLVELLSCSPPPLRALEDLQTDQDTLPLIYSLLDRSSPTLQYLSFTFPFQPSPTPPHNPNSYPLLTFPHLNRISFRDTFHSKTLLLTIAASRWILPSLHSLETTASPNLVPFLTAHGSKIRELGLRTQYHLDINTYESLLALTPNLHTLSWMIWEATGNELDHQNPVDFNIRQPILSVRRINISHTVGTQNYFDRSFLNIVVRFTVNKTNFPSLERVVFKTSFPSISKNILAWGRTLSDQGVVVEWE